MSRAPLLMILVGLIQACSDTMTKVPQPPDAPDVRGVWEAGAINGEEPPVDITPTFECDEEPHWRTIDRISLTLSGGRPPPRRWSAGVPILRGPDGGTALDGRGGRP